MRVGMSCSGWQSHMRLYSLPLCLHFLPICLYSLPPCLYCLPPCLYCLPLCLYSSRMCLLAVAREALVRQLGDMKREAAAAAEALHKHKEVAGAREQKKGGFVESKTQYTHHFTTMVHTHQCDADTLHARLRAAKADVANEAAAALEARRQAADAAAQLRAAAESNAALERRVAAAQHDAAAAARALQVGSFLPPPAVCVCVE